MKENKMQERNETVTLTFSQFWEIEQLLKREIDSMGQYYECAEEDDDEYGMHVFEMRLSSLRDAHAAISKWGGRAK